MLTRPTPAELRDLLRQPRLAHVFELGQRHAFGGDRERQDRRVGRIDLGVDRRHRQIARQQIVGRIDRRLHFLLGDVEAEIETELQRDDRGAGRARRRHLVEAGHLAELPLQGSGHRRRHHFRAGARIEGLHLDRRIVDLRQGRERQERVGDDAGQQDRHHEQRRGDRTQNEGLGDVHRFTSLPRARASGLRSLRARKPQNCGLISPRHGATSESCDGIRILRRVGRLCGAGAAVPPAPNCPAAGVALRAPGMITRVAIAQPVGAVDHHSVAERRDPN